VWKREGVKDINMSGRDMVKLVYVAKLLRFPKKTKVQLGLERDMWCHFHRKDGHGKDKCYTLRKQLEQLIMEGLLEAFFKRE